MPTSLPTRSRPNTGPDFFVLFLVAFAAAFFVLELADPAPMDVEAALMVSP